ncbi:MULTISPECIES: hypothetical protein [unclassified Vibrio]|uniref:hypothetical protein n=1 Tax=unclassified Vibrio TaxID=2614977 RepID=UPI00207535F3|nr:MULTISPECIES: hypothetical protein [unclassified Vibrio]MDK9777993.1 hypothetical protein [Vibrio sp. D401a]MDK9801500.1 hypothetical protein [Vibrio sp. D406a]USD48596.1 hypothetical protein J4N37_07950 [Vibrio sp. SCSIO 43153]
MKKSLLTLAFLSTFGAQAAYLDEATVQGVITTELQEEAGLLGQSAETEKVNYGDPTASYTGFGVEKDVSGNNKGVRSTFVYGLTENGTSQVMTAELGTNNFNGGIDYRARYFNIDQSSGFGWSIDAIGGYQKLTEKRDGITGYDATNTIMAGVVQKFQVTDAIIVVPMLYGGNTWMNAKVAGVKCNKDSLVGQTGVYAMYGFDAGHWLYANPKTTYVKELKGWSNQIEIGGGYMVAENMSVGFKVDTSQLNTSIFGKHNSETKASLNYHYYF